MMFNTRLDKTDKKKFLFGLQSALLFFHYAPSDQPKASERHS